MAFQDYSAPQIAAIAIALIVGITFHEFMHAFVADQLGDHRPRALGRVTLNPLAHLDPIGSLVFVLLGFGWGKPVPVNAYALRPGRIGMTYVSVAGPLANMFVASLFGIVFRIAELAGLLGPGEFATNVLYAIVVLNVALGLFNLLPIPPLDGYNLVLPFLPPQTAYTVQRYAPYGVIILLVLVLLPGASPLGWLFELAVAIARMLTGV